MNTKTETKNLADYIMIGILITNIILTFIFKAFNPPKAIQFINISTVFLIISIASPTNDYIKKGILRDKLVILSLIIKGALFTIFTISLYKVLLSTNYNLKYAYWVALISFLFMAAIFITELLIQNYKKRKQTGKKHNVLYIALSITVIVLIKGFAILSLIDSINYPQKSIVIEQVKVPQYISIYKYGDDEGRRGSLNSILNSSIKITDLEFIKKIVSDIQPGRIENITSTELFNYQRMRDDNSPYYLIMFGYEDIFNENDGIENGYFTRLAITSNGYVAMEISNSKKGLLYNKYYDEVYPIRLSKDTIDMIFRYIQNNNVNVSIE